MHQPYLRHPSPPHEIAVAEVGGFLYDFLRRPGAGGANRIVFSLKISMNEEKKNKPIILLGTTECGTKFRPSDWANRLAMSVSTVGPRRRIISHPRVHTAIYDGVSAVVVDRVLETENLMMFEFFINFAKGNKLQILNLDDE